MYKKYDFWITGIIPGIFIPFIAALGYYAYSFHWEGFTKFFEDALTNHLLSPLLALGCIMNLGLFFLFIQKDMYLAGRGVILSTFIYAGSSVLIKLLT